MKSIRNLVQKLGFFSSKKKPAESARTAPADQGTTDSPMNKNEAAAPTVPAQPKAETAEPAKKKPLFLPPKEPLEKVIRELEANPTSIPAPTAPTSKAA